MDDQHVVSANSGSWDWADSLFNTAEVAWAHARNFVNAIPDRTNRFIDGTAAGTVALHGWLYNIRNSFVSRSNSTGSSSFSLRERYNQAKVELPRDIMGRLGFGFALGSPFIGSYLAYSGLVNLRKGRYAESLWRLLAGSTLFYGLYSTGRVFNDYVNQGLPIYRQGESQIHTGSLFMRRLHNIRSMFSE